MARQHLKFLVLVNLKIYYDRKPETGDRKLETGKGKSPGD